MYTINKYKVEVQIVANFKLKYKQRPIICPHILR